MLQVASVAALICDSIDAAIDRDEIISACLLHDLGNIMKYNLENSPDKVEPLGLDHWVRVQKEFKAKYADEHAASHEIAREIGVNRITLDLVDKMGKSEYQVELAGQDNLNQKICSYADMRGGMGGIVSIEERIADLKRRHANKKFRGIESAENERAWRDALAKIEGDIFDLCTISPNKIDDDSIETYFKKLKRFSVV